MFTGYSPFIIAEIRDAARFDMRQGYHLKTYFFHFYKAGLKYLGPNLLEKLKFFEEKNGVLKSV